MKHTWRYLVLCVAAVLSLAFLLTTGMGGGLKSQNREGLLRDLTTLALRAQDYYMRAVWEGGGGGSFAGLTADASGMSRLTAKPITPNGILVITTAGDYSHVALRGYGIEKGNDGAPITIRMDVFADSMSVMFDN